jgi:hypothetical protein
MISAKRMLGVYPYDGSFDSAPEHQKTIHEVIENTQHQQAAAVHPDPACPMRVFLLSDTMTNKARHTIPCTCDKLLSPVEVAQAEAAGAFVIEIPTVYVELPIQCDKCHQWPTECECHEFIV